MDEELAAAGVPADERTPPAARDGRLAGVVVDVPVARDVDAREPAHRAILASAAAPSAAPTSTPSAIAMTDAVASTAVW